jgi:hypothetical protein
MDVAEVILVVPNARTEPLANDRVRVDFDDELETALEDIYEAIGCKGFPRRPELAYKLSTAPKRTRGSRLRSDADWDELRREAEAAARKKKDDVPVDILVEPEVSRLVVCGIWMMH